MSRCSGAPEPVGPADSSSTSFADWRWRDPFEVPANPLEALVLVRCRLNLALNGGRELLDHDPVTGYLPKLERQVKVSS